MNYVAVPIVFAIVLGHSFSKSRHFIGLNHILLCSHNSSQITKHNQDDTNKFWKSVLITFVDPFDSLHGDFFNICKGTVVENSAKDKTSTQ